jgi:hypothetical protein
MIFQSVVLPMTTPTSGVVPVPGGDGVIMCYLLPKSSRKCLPIPAQEYFVHTERKIIGFWQSKTGNAIRFSGGTGTRQPEFRKSGTFVFFFI